MCNDLLSKISILSLINIFFLSMPLENMGPGGTERERDAVKFTAGFYSMASVITEMSSFSPFSISQEGLKIQVNSTQNCDSAKYHKLNFSNYFSKNIPIGQDWEGVAFQRSRRGLVT